MLGERSLTVAVPAMFAETFTLTFPLANARLTLLLRSFAENLGLNVEGDAPVLGELSTGVLPELAPVAVTVALVAPDEPVKLVAVT